MKNQNVNKLRITSICLTILLLGLMSASITHAASETKTLTAGQFVTFDVGGNHYVFYVYKIDVTNKEFTLNLNKNHYFAKDGRLSPSQTWEYSDDVFHLHVYVNNVYKSSGGNNVVELTYSTSSKGTAPVAAFTASPTSGPSPLVVAFTDQSTNSPASWKWDFGDGATSTSQNPTHTYTKSGSYTVTLTATNAAGSSKATKSITVTSAPQKPVAAFSASPTSGPSPLVVAFTDQSTNSPASWKWDFGDGATSTSQNPTHTYTKSGSYTVTLTAINAVGSSKATKSITVTSASQKPVAAFTASPTSGTKPLKVQFTDTSTGSPTSWKWDFGDGTTSTTRNPLHTYIKEGSHTVTFTATNAAGSSTVTKTKYITVTASSTPSKPVAAFTASPTSGTNPLKVQFTDTSTGSPTSWKWDFGDGTTSTTHNPLHTYIKAGTHTVTLTATNAAGSGSVTKTKYITVTASSTPSKPVAAFTASPTSGAIPLKVQFTDQSTNNPISWKWDFGDGSATSTTHNPLHTYIKAGTHKVTLTATNAAGSSTVTKTAYIKVTNPVKPVAAFTAAPTSGTKPLKVQFTDKSTGSPTSWKWDFGDGTTSTTHNPLHTYIKKGKLTVTLTVKNSAGTSTKTIKSYITVK